ncbi:response regulator [Zhouia sp. PK063]|uniref:response regulator n=1 Tax=Zhouia sp. PK063 TaxID=3373602 RepID=UPI0037A86546
METYSVLLVDDHAMILEGYKNVLQFMDLPYTLKIDTVFDCDQAWGKLQQKKYDLVLSDLNFSNPELHKIKDGEQLCMRINANFPATKIIIITMIEDAFRLRGLIKNINPNGLLVKGDTSPSELVFCVSKVIENQVFYGNRVSRVLAADMQMQYDLDQIDKEILYQLHLGSSNNEIADKIHMSLRAVETRKRKIKDLFGIIERGNKELLQKAKEAGYI